VIAGYGITAVAIGGYAAWLVRRLRTLRRAQSDGR
jgi:hypothetical protein